MINFLTSIINGIFTTIFLIPALIILILKYCKKQYVRVENDTRAVPSQTKKKYKLAERNSSETKV